MKDLVIFYLEPRMLQAILGAWPKLRSQVEAELDEIKKILVGTDQSLCQARLLGENKVYRICVFVLFEKNLFFGEILVHKLAFFHLVSAAVGGSN